MAQSDLASVSGTITDPSGAVVPNAQITLSSESTGAVRKSQTNASGLYAIPGIAPGRYTISVDAPGFQHLVLTGNNLDAASVTTRNLSVSLGQASQEVKVAAKSEALEADSATLGRVIDAKQIDSLPVNGRNPIMVALTKAGITSGPTSATGSGGSAAGSNLSSFQFSTGTGAIQINGARDRDNQITYDGAIAVRIRASGDSVGVVDMENVDEVQVLSANYAPEYGRSTGGQIRITTRSGSNEFHGSLYEYLQNPDLNANTWVRNHNYVNNNNPDYPAELKTNFVAPFTYNQFGGSFSGPLYIPHLFPKGKVFFLYSEAFVKYPQTVTNPVTVPNPAFRAGDFSSLINQASPANNHYIKDPQSALPCATQTGLGGGCFPGNIIPANRLSSNGVGLLSIYPTPTPNFQLGTENLLQVARYPANQQIDSGNLDIIPTERDYIRFRLTHFYYHEDDPFSAAFDNVPRLYDRPNQTGSLDWVHTFSPHMSNEVLLTASHDAARLSIDTTPTAYNGNGPAYSRASYGIDYPFLYPGTKDLPNKIPTVQFLTTSSITTMDGSTYPSHSQGEIFDFADTFTRMIGNHLVRAGFLYERSGENDDDQIAFSASNAGQTNNQNGQFTFSTSNPLTSGYDLADAALGNYYTYAEVGARDETPYRGNLYEMFVQDAWKVTPKLHLDYGVRYSSIHPYYSLYNNAGSFDPAFYNPAVAVTVNPATGNPIAGSGDPLNGTVLWGNGFTSNAAQHVAAAASGQYNDLFHNLPRGYLHVQPFLFQPRVGIAYQIDAKTVIRSGAGRYVNHQGVSDFVFAGGVPPLQQVASLSGGVADNPGGGAAGSYPQLTGSFERSAPQPEAYIWNVSVERELPYRTVAEISYVGRHALHQQIAGNLNQLQAGTLTNPANKGVNANALRPYLGYGPINYVEQTGTSAYEGLQLDVNRRFANSLAFDVAYTFASSRDCDSFQKQLIPNTYDPKSICGPADYDIRNVLAMNAVYQIPFRSGSHIANEALSGWQLTQAYQFQTGAPFSIATSQDVAGVGPGSGSQLLNITPGAKLGGARQFSNSNTDTNQWFTTTNSDGTPIFTLPTAGTFTSQLNRNVLRAPGQEYFNASMQKRFAIYQEKALTFRFDAFNFLNHPNWNAPDTNYNDATFGKVTSKNGQRSMQASLRFSF